MKFSFSFFLSLFAFLTIVSCQEVTSEQSETTAEEARVVELLPPTAFLEAYSAESDALLIDCRTPREVARGIVDGAVNIDFRSPSFTDEAQKLDKSKPIYIYCQAGGRSAVAANQLISLGFEQVHDMQGGFSAYSKE